MKILQKGRKWSIEFAATLFTYCHAVVHTIPTPKLNLNIAHLVFYKPAGQKKSIGKLGTTIEVPNLGRFFIDIKGCYRATVEKLDRLIIKLGISLDLIVWEMVLKDAAELLCELDTMIEGLSLDFGQKVSNALGRIAEGKRCMVGREETWARVS